MDEKDLLKKLDGLTDTIQELKKDISEIKLVFEGSSMGATGMATRVSELEKKVMDLKVFYWKAVGVISISFPILIYLIQKYLL
jgi:hypothetical protein